MSESGELGKKGEDLAAGYLKKKGYKILHRNWKSGRRELDIVAENNDCVVFAEVKTRSGDFLSRPGDTVSREKQRLLILAAEAYIRKYNITKDSRFDIITIISKDNSQEVEHIENAFYPTLR